MITANCNRLSPLPRLPRSSESGSDAGSVGTSTVTTSSTPGSRSAAPPPAGTSYRSIAAGAPPARKLPPLVAKPAGARTWGGGVAKAEAAVACSNTCSSSQLAATAGSTTTTAAVTTGGGAVEDVSSGSVGLEQGEVQRAVLEVCGPDAASAFLSHVPAILQALDEAMATPGSRVDADAVSRRKLVCNASDHARPAACKLAKTPGSRKAGAA